jgi:hypothetical protein
MSRPHIPKWYEGEAGGDCEEVLAQFAGARIDVRALSA